MAGAAAVGHGVQKQADVDWVPVYVAVPAAIIGVLLCRVLRKKASTRYLNAARRDRHAGASPAFTYTLMAWLLAGTATGLIFGTLYVAANVDKPRPGELQEDLAKYPLPIQFVFAGLAILGTAAYYSWNFRHKHELPVLAREGIAFRVEPPRALPPAEALRLRTKMWLKGTLIDGAFFAGVIVPSLLSDDPPKINEFASGVFGVLGGPAVVSFALLVVLLVHWPTRRVALDALLQPSSITAIGIVLVGAALAAVGERGWVTNAFELQIAGNIVALVGVLIASATCLNIMRSGSQPWMGMLFLTGSYVFGYLYTSDSEAALPSSVTAWVVAIVAAVYTISQIRTHWNEWNRVVNAYEAPAQPL